MKAKPSAPTRLEVSVDYPREAEPVSAGHYAIRVSAIGAQEAQVQADGEGWCCCREAVGHFWLDWWPKPGRRLIEARARVGKGRWAKSAARACLVSPS